MSEKELDLELMNKLKKVGEQFLLDGGIDSYELITRGNINTTYRVRYKKEDGSFKEYIFQKVNTYVFREPRQIMRNIDYVTEHIRRKNKDTHKRSLHYHHTSNRDNFWFDENGDFWRVSNYVSGTVTYQISSDPLVLYMAGRAFGEFQKQLSDFDASLLFETIPNFHNTKKRLEAFFEDVERDEFGRVNEVRDEIDYISSCRERVSLLTEMLEKGELPLRVTHNDTKINNVLFDEKTKDPVIVIDLDTVMPGLAAHDFGDAVRFAANTAEEDEPDASKVSLDLDLYRAFAEGFVEETAGGLSDAEINSLALGAFTITIELALRFLDDYITGDKYFKTNYEGHNLVRCRCQLALARDMEKKFDEMNKIVLETAQKKAKTEIF
jgi:thiamine kinase-like enzyme